MQNELPATITIQKIEIAFFCGLAAPIQLHRLEVGSPQQVFASMMEIFGAQWQVEEKLDE